MPRLAVLWLLSAAGPVFSQTPTFPVDFDGPTRIEGPPGSSVTFSAKVRLFTGGLNAGEKGAQGWVLSLGAQGCSIIGASTAGTDAASVEQGGIRQDGFELTELTTGTGNEGAVSLVILSLTSRVTMDPGDSPHTLLVVTAEGRVSESDLCDPCRLDFVDGKQGSGQPLWNEITYRGKSFRPMTQSLRVQLCSPACPEGVACGSQLPGDCNQDGRTDISDAVCLLGALFLGNPSEFPCGDGTRESFPNQVLLSGNGDTKVDLSDAIYLLSYLFLGGPPHAEGVECLGIGQCGNTCS